MKRNLPADKLLCGDQIALGNHTLLIRSIEGPDSFGTYDVSGVDEKGLEHYEPVNGTVRLIM